MKKTIAVISVMLAFSVMLSGCGNNKPADDTAKKDAEASSLSDVTSEIDASSEENTDKTEKADEKTSSAKTEKPSQSVKLKTDFTSKGKKIASSFPYAAILDDITNIDFYQKKPDFSKYTKKTVKEDDITSIDQYYQGKTLVYEVPNDFGETGYFHYTKTNSGKPVKVKYWNDFDGKLNEITMDGDGYNICMRSFNKSSPYGADEINVTITKNNPNDLPEFAEYVIEKQTVRLYDVKYYSDSGYMHYYYNPGENGKMTENEVTEFTVCKSDVSTATVKQITEQSEPYILQTLAGRHKLSYKQNGEKKNWFITCNLYVIFNTKEAAESYVKNNGLGSNSKVSVSNENCTGDNWYVQYSDVTLKIADGFKAGNQSFNDFALSEFYDLSFADIAVNSNCEVTSISYNNSIISYY